MQHSLVNQARLSIHMIIGISLLNAKVIDFFLIKKAEVFTEVIHLKWFISTNISICSYQTQQHLLFLFSSKWSQKTLSGLM
jgi:hypothetical protein